MMFMIMAMMVMIAMLIMHMTLLAMGGLAMGGSVIMMIMPMMIVPVVVMSMMIVIMALFAHRLVISAAIGLEGGFDMGNFATLGARHIFNHMIAANADTIGHDLRGDMAIA